MARVNNNDIDVEVKPQRKSQEHQQATYKVLCCGNSALDLVLIPCALIGVYLLTGSLFAACMRAVMQTDQTAAALWMFFGVYVIFVIMLGVVLAVTSHEKKMLAKEKAAEADE
ncbi:TPA: hypothetical protein N0F65_006072 [Lagenidium giganteum]|uniref:Uncharacterized protein n=1 Tax=Lagenidium giganteum TaxID=4803 RepID=A0AAV2YQ50_9STRA|nr:TPA: hypothetical protein N0F65_006072 [Lagenidium giganteum]